MDIWLLAVVLIIYYALHSILAASVVKNSLYAFIPKIYYRLFFNFVSILLLLAIIPIYRQTVTYPLFDQTIFHQVLGGILLISGAIIGFQALRQYDLGEFSGLKNDEPSISNQLNTSGLNSVVRHPLYLATLLIVWGLFLQSSQLRIFTIAGITTAYTFIGIYFEELKLIKQFGPEYLAYQKRVKKIIPFIL